MFKQSPIEFEELETKEVDGKRFYLTPVGDMPSVTTWLGELLDKEGVTKWREMVGEKTADFITELACSQGTAVHSLMESYLINDPLPKNIMPSNKELFVKAKPVLDMFVDEVYATEFPVWSTEVGLAGRVDAFVNWAGMDVVLDYKTGRTEKKLEHMEGYFFQGALYSFMVSQHTGRRIDKFVILHINPETKPKIIIRPVTKYLKQITTTIPEGNLDEVFFGRNSPYYIN